MRARDVVVEDIAQGAINGGGRRRRRRGLSPQLVRPKVIHRLSQTAKRPRRRAGRAKLADFGIARRFRTTFSDTKNHAIGTLNYMAPGFRGRQGVDVSCDAYSFAMIAHLDVHR